MQQIKLDTAAIDELEKQSAADMKALCDSFGIPAQLLNAKGTEVIFEGKQYGKSVLIEAMPAIQTALRIERYLNPRK